ncbi:16S rRNA (cytosine(967)-C(5))-methyltransferase RsmB [Acidovorax sp. NB1]|uniref:16S rRNA (cytosine(967)-C(5))-methyltransferase RsmB n=1 Tax=Acidovorax sp. NB1 TaxID=1943571 RepID=UPI0010D5C3E2|nr:16S rRNA (cytosine(967)-C(5))-methyltransferase RsmB [Acidovorax sp. NB1]GDY38219.1 ribosomal RNA small subunit methyltransferase B [Acidovorax sp. NB1]
MNPPPSHRTGRPGGSNPSRPPRPRTGGAGSQPGAPAGAATGSVALWQQLAAVAGALQSIRAGQSGTAALAAVDAGLRPGVQALLFQVLRQLGRAEALRRQLAARTPPPAADALLCTALALGWNPNEASYEAFTLVNQAVEAAKHHPATRAQASFINGCLRRFLRERDALVAATDSDPVARWNHPAWWIQRLRKDHPQHWEQILRANNAHAPMTLRINQQKCTLPRYQQALEAINLIAIPAGETGLALQHPVPVPALPGFAEGWASVQDAAAQMAAPLLLQGLNLAEPLRVLDACAAPGGKTAHLLEMAPAGAPLQVTALEIDATRSARIGDTLQRLGLNAQVLVADAARPQDWWQARCGGALFDAILLDAPCTASGIVRRHPDVRWLRRESDIAQLATLQAQLLKALWPLLRPGGRLLYCTCSVFRAEGDAQVQTFLAHNTDAQLLPSPGHLIPGNADKGGAVPDNLNGDHDGFFYALLQKSP